MKDGSLLKIGPSPQRSSNEAHGSITSINLWQQVNTHIRIERYPLWVQIYEQVQCGAENPCCRHTCMSEQKSLFIHKGIADSMQIEPILFEYLSVLERIGRAKGKQKVYRTRKLAGMVNISSWATRPNLVRRWRIILPTIWFNRNVTKISSTHFETGPAL